ncbi:MAG: hypothetical protein NTX98_03695 [Candidatus Doudnabacteria bacterium]|nr:hypothetical protein [Candidatus Doudnabacteria bacterium]
MEQLESQIAKINLGNVRQTNSFVYVLAEKAADLTDAEIFLIAELPLLNPAAIGSCQQICMAIGSTLLRAYKRPAQGNAFENAISLVNEELGKLVESGQTDWINKLNCIIGVKNKNSFSIATCGKTVAFLLRDNILSDISNESPSSHPLKTFENYSEGKIYLGDILILSTNQLFNFLSIDRIKNILAGYDFLSASQTIIELLKENAGPETAFGIIINQQVRPGETASEEIDLENYILEQPKYQPGLLAKTAAFLKNLFLLDRTKRVPDKTAANNFGWKQKFINFKIKVFSLGKKLNSGLHGFLTFLNAVKKLLNPQNFKSYSPQKKFFFLSALILLIAFAVNVTVAVKYQSSKTKKQQAAVLLQETQKLLANTQDSLAYNDQKKIEKTKQAEVVNLGSLSKEATLIKLPKYLATQTNGNIISYNKETGQIQDGALKCGQTIIFSVALKADTLVIHNGSGLLVCDPSTGQIGQGFANSVPDKTSAVGLAFYPSNGRVYLLDKRKNQAVSFLISGKNIQKPFVSLKDAPEIGKAQDFAIDGNIYLLTDTGIVKYTAGRLAEFNMPYLSKPFSGKGKIYTETNFKNLYLLDKGNNRILIFDKKGNLISTLISDQFNKMDDFAIDEQNKTIFVLNDGSLLKVTY